MALRIRFQYDSGLHLAFAIERLSDGLAYDFATKSFAASPGTPTAPLPEDTGLYAGRYKATLTPTPAAQFLDGDYVVTVFDRTRLDAKEPAVIAELSATMRGGDDSAPGPSAMGAMILQSIAQTISAAFPTTP